MAGAHFPPRQLTKRLQSDVPEPRAAMLAGSPGLPPGLANLGHAHEMRKSGLGVVQQRGIVVFYDDVIVGEFIADLMVEDQVIVELEVVGALSDMHVPQCRNDLRATGRSLCLLIDFGRSKVEIRRVTAQA